MGTSKELPRREEVNAGYPVGIPGELGWPELPCFRLGHLKRNAEERRIQNL